MAHIFDVLSTINGQLNILSKDYDGRGKARHLNNAPEFMLMAINRAIDSNPDIMIDKDHNATIEKPILGATGDHYNPVYIAVVGNINSPVVDKVPIMVDYKDAHGPGTAYIIGIPKILFSADSDKAAELLRKIYLPVLDMDKEMQYSASPSILIIQDKPGVDIKTYDLTMILVALACIHINLRNWYVETDNGKPVDPSAMLVAFSEFDQYKADDAKNGVFRALTKYGKNINDIRDAVGNGKLVKLFLYNDD